jgi:branched-chain amino acid transport system substrate-binding protein
MKRVFLVAALVAALAATAATVGNASPRSQAAPTVGDHTLIACGGTRTLGIAAPVTGLAASLGVQQLRWGQFYLSRYNKTHKKTKFTAVVGDTQLPATAQAIQVAERFASNSEILGVVGPAGSQEVQVTTAPFKSGGLGFVSGSATRTSLTTDGKAKGYFFRVVPNDDQQGPRVANWIRTKLHATRVVVVDAQNSYSTGLADKVQQLLSAAGLNVKRDSVSEANTTDFSSLVARIPADTQVVYTPWQLSAKAQLLGQQLRAGGRNARMFGSDGLFDPDNFKIPGSLISFFPIDLKNKVLAAYKKGPGKGKSDLFGMPTYAAAQVVTRAIDKACGVKLTGASQAQAGSVTRAQVRAAIAGTMIPKKQSILGFAVRFVKTLKLPVGPGDMESPANFGIYQIQKSGAYLRVG